MEVIAVTVDDIPYKQEVVLDSTSHIVQFRHNPVTDTVEVDLYDTAGNLIHSGETIVYGMPLWYPFLGQNGYPKVNIVPVSVDGVERLVNMETLGTLVKLAVI